jgi:hypothetical protein
MTVLLRSDQEMSLERLFWDPEIWLEAMLHLTQCHCDDCQLCFAIVEHCLEESRRMEARLQDCT